MWMHLAQRKWCRQCRMVQVTIDVRAPTRGVLRAVLVKEEDTVTVGQVIAVLDEADASAKAPAAAPPSTSASAPPAPKNVSLEELTDAASRVSDSTLRGNKARIMFPPRKTADGHTISAMPVVDQKTYTQRGLAAMMSSSAPAASASAGRAASKTSAAGAILTEAVPRTMMAELEMESIMLGGAPP